MSESEENIPHQGQAQDLGAEEILKIASQIGTRDYFMTQQARNLDEWAENASDIFKLTADVMTAEYEFKANNNLQDYSDVYQEHYSRSKKQFDAYCILNRKVQKKNDEIENLANHLSHKNSKKNFFNAWKGYSDRRKYVRKMDERSERYQHERIMSHVLKEWLRQTMDNSKTKIKNDVLQKTESEVSRIQEQYERLIKTLEETLEKKLTELKKEEEQHKLLHDKYESMYERAPVEAGSSRN